MSQKSTNSKSGILPPDWWKPIVMPIILLENTSDRISGQPILFVQPCDAHLLEYADELYRKV